MWFLYQLIRLPRNPEGLVHGMVMRNQFDVMHGTRAAKADFGGRQEEEIMMLSHAFKGRLHAVIQMAHEQGVDLVCEVNPSANWVSFQCDGVDARAVSMRLDEVMALSTVALLAKVFQGLGISSRPVADVWRDPVGRSRNGRTALDDNLFRCHEISMLKLLAWECETGRRDPHGEGSRTRDVAKFVASQTQRL